MSSETIALIALAVSIVVSLLGFGEKIFGGGNKLARAFAELDKKKTEEITLLRNEFYQRVETHDGNYRVGLDAITANIHAMQLGLLEFRAKMAEDYMRRDSYYKASEDLKRDFKEKHDDLKDDMNKGFSAVKEQLDTMAQAIEAGRKSTSRSHA